MKKLEEICSKYNIALCYIFGSNKEKGDSILEGNHPEIKDSEPDIDFAVLFSKPPVNTLETYALLSLDLQDIVSPFKADLLFLHEVDHLIQLEAIKEINIFSISEEFRDAYEEKVMMLASYELEVFKLNKRGFFEAIDNGYFELEYKADRR